MNTREPGRLADLLGSSLPFTIEEKQKLLGEINVRARLEKLGQFLSRQLAVLELSSKIQEQVGSEITKAQRDHFLRQQIKAIQEELGEGEGDNPELDELWERLQGGQAPGRGADRGRARDRAAGGDAPELGRVLDRPDLPRLAGRPPLEQVEPRPARPPPGPEDPRRRPLRPGEDQGADPRIPGRPQAEEGHEGADPLLRRPAGHGQDLAGQEHRQGAGARVRPDQPGRRPRRGRDPRPPPHLRRRDARPDHPGDPQGRDEQPGLHARRGRQARRRLPGRPLRRAAGGARPRAERHLPRPLPRRRFRPVEGDVHRHGEHARDDPAPAARPDGGAPAPGLQRGREDPDRAEVHHPQAARGARPDGQGRDVRRRRDPAGSSPTTPARRACGTSSARSPRSAARSPASTPRGRRKATTVAAAQVAEVARPAPLLPRGRRPDRHPRRRHRPGLDADRRRDPLHRGDRHARQGGPDADRPARRVDARERPGGHELPAEPRQAAADRRRRGSARPTSTSTSRPARSPRTAPRPAWRSPRP